jgi:hypothetical protein
VKIAIAPIPAEVEDEKSVKEIKSEKESSKWLYK